MKVLLYLQQIHLRVCVDVHGEKAKLMPSESLQPYPYPYSSPEPITIPNLNHTLDPKSDPGKLWRSDEISSCDLFILREIQINHHL